jgi:hypothetical protein
MLFNTNTNEITYLIKNKFKEHFFIIKTKKFQNVKGMEGIIENKKIVIL